VKHDKIDATLTHFFASFVRCALIAVTVIAVLGQFGVQTASLITVLGAAGQAGTIKELNLFFSVMATPDNIRITVPNSNVWGSALRNFSANPTRQVDILAGISFDDDIDKAMEVMRGIVAEDDRIHGDPEPFLAVMAMNDSSVDIVLRVWVDNANFWTVKFDLTKAIKQGFDANDITIPFPTRIAHNVGE
jgi:small conductance mechanosensitive channel